MCPSFSQTSYSLIVGVEGLKIALAKAANTAIIHQLAPIHIPHAFTIPPRGMEWVSASPT